MSATSQKLQAIDGGPEQSRPRYDAFLSYSHRADRKVARRLQSALQRLAKPRDQPWALRIFRDETDLTASPAAWLTIKAALDQSNFFLLLASPEAAASKWVPKELCYWLTAGALEDATDLPTLTAKIDRSRVPKLLIVLTGGFLSWDDRGRDFDWQATTALPRLLSRIFDFEPLWVVLGTESPKAGRESIEFMESAARLSVPIRFGDRGDLAERARELLDQDYLEFQRSSRRNRIAVIVLAVLSIVAVGAGVFAEVQRRQAEKEADRASREATRANGSKLEADQQRKSAETSALEATTQRNEAVTQQHLAEQHALETMREQGLQLQQSGRDALLDGDSARALPFLLGALDHGVDTVALRLMLTDAAYVPALSIQTSSDIKHAELNRAGTAFVTVDDQRHATIWDAALGSAIFQPQIAAAWAAFDPTGTRLVTTDAYSDNRVRTGDEGFSVWDTIAKKLLLGPVRFDDAYEFPSFSKNGAFIFSFTSMGLPHTWSTGSGATVAPILHALGGYEIIPAGGSRLFSALEGFKPSSPLSMRFRTPETAWPATLGGPAPTIKDQEFRISFTMDNTRVITTSWRTARVWDESSGEPLGPPVFHNATVTAADLSRDGHRLVTASADKTARVWDVSTGSPLTPPLMHDAPLMGVVFSPTADRVVTQSENGLLYEWNANTGVKIGTLGFGKEAVYSPDGTRIVAQSSDTTITIFDAATGAAVPEGPADSRKIGSYAFSPDSREVLTTGLEVLTPKGDHARVWDAATGLPLTPPIEPMQSISFSYDASKLLTTDGRNARVWNLSERHVPLVDVARGEQTTLAAFSPDGAHLVSANRDRTVRVWNTSTGAPTTPPLEHRTEVCGVTFNSSGTTVLTVSRDNVARLWNATTGQQIGNTLDGWGGCEVSQDSFDTDGRFVVGGTKGAARLWDAKTGRVIRDYLVDALDSVSISPDGTRIVTTTWFTGGGRWARLWDTSTAKPLAAPMEDGIVAKFSRDGKRLAVGGIKSARIWDALNGTPISPEMRAAYVEALAFNSTGTRVVIGGNDRTARVWDADAGTPISPPLEHPQFVTKVSFSDDDSVVVTLAKDEATRVWDAETGKLLRPVLRYASSNDYDYGPNGTQIAVPIKDALRLMSYPIDRRSLEKLRALGRCAPFILVNSTLVNIAAGPCKADLRGPITR